MSSGISGVGNYTYLSQIGQAQIRNSLANGIFAKIGANGSGSANQDELSAQLQTAQSSSASGSVASFINLLQNMGQTGTTGETTGATGTTASSGTEADNTLAGANNGYGSTSQDALAAFQSSLTTQFGTDATGSDSASNETDSGNTTAAFVQQALGKYMALTPAGQGIATASSFLGIA